MGSISSDIRRLLEDCEFFITDILKDETLSEFADKTRQILLNNFTVVHNRNPLDFPSRKVSSQEDISDDNRSPSLGRSAPSDDNSVAADYQDDGGQEHFGDIGPVAAQDLSNILKQGHLEKKRRDPGFFGSEWQKRWCVLNNNIFFYYGTEKDKMQKGAFYINGYSAELVSGLRKDYKKNACFELNAPGRRNFQFTASSLQEAREWVNQINFVLKDLSSTLIPYDEDEGEEEDEEETYDDIEGVTGPAAAQESHHHKQGGQEPEGIDEEIYEELPEDDFTEPAENRDNSPVSSSDYANYYQGLWDCAADEPDELAFQRGDLIYIISKEYNIHGWWVGELHGTVGIVPKDFLHPAYII